MYVFRSRTSGNDALCLKTSTIYELRTDSVLYRPPKRRKVFLEDLQYKDLHLMRNKLEGEARRLNEWHDMAASDVDEKLYRIKKSLTEEDQLGCNPKRPSRSCGKINVNFLTWKNLNVEEAENQVIVKRQSLLVLGAPGTGKTTYLQGITERLMSLGLKVDIISKTHCASARAGQGGRTADYWIRRHIINGDCTTDYLWIDEISQLDIELITALNRLTYTSVKFLISGDFNQFGALGNSFRGAPIAENAFEKSNLLHRMAGGNRLTLTECKRSDSQLFDFYTRLIPGGDLYEQPIQEAVKLARQQFKYEGICDLNLTLSH